jgi:cytochrome P450
VGLDRGHELLSEHGDSLAGATHRYTDYVTGGFLRFMEGDAHRKYKAIFRKALSPTVVGASEPVVRDVARRELRLMANDCATEHGVAPSPYVARIAYDALARALFGLVPGQPAYEEFTAAFGPIGAQDMPRRFTWETRDALQKIRSLVDAQVGRLRAGCGTEAEAGSAVGAMVALDHELPDLTCIDNLVFALRIGSSDVTGLLSWMLAFVGSDPELTRRLAELARGNDPDARDLAERSMCETLRLAQSEYLYRTIKDDIEFQGHRLPRGWLLRICVWESHRDPAVFEDPDRFDPDRFAKRALTHSEYAPFGSGPHSCLGVGVTTMTCRAIFEELAAGYDWEVEWDGKATRRRRHWGHWRPSSSLRVRVRPA